MTSLELFPHVLRCANNSGLNGHFHFGNIKNSNVELNVDCEFSSH